MARDGSGTYTRVEGPYVNGNVADADEMNNELDDIASALTASINTAGTKAFGADQSMGGFKLTDLAAPSSANDAARKAYVDSAIAAAAQPLDAALTAVAAALGAWTTGTPVIQVTAVDTVSLTLTPSVTSITVGAGSVTACAVQPSGDPNTGLVFSSADTMDVVNGGTANWRFNSSGNFVSPASKVIQVGDGTVTVPGMTFVSDPNNGWYRIATDNWAGAVGGAKFIDISSTLVEFSLGVAGRLVQVTGVGGETLAAATHKNRQLVLDGNITLPNSTFSAGDWHVLIGDGSARTITRGSGVTMYVNGVDSATATLPARGKAGVQWETASVAHLSGDAY